MKKLIVFMATAMAFAACSEVDEVEATHVLTVTGYSSADPATRTSFGTPDATEIPFKWTAGDYIWLGTNKSAAIPGDCTLAQFTFNGGSRENIFGGKKSNLCRRDYHRW